MGASAADCCRNMQRCACGPAAISDSATVPSATLQDGKATLVTCESADGIDERAGGRDEMKSEASRFSTCGWPEGGQRWGGRSASPPPPPPLPLYIPPIYAHTTRAARTTSPRGSSSCVRPAVPVVHHRAKQKSYFGECSPQHPECPIGLPARVRCVWASFASLGPRPAESRGWAVPHAFP